jgi:hypothetical protein
MKSCNISNTDPFVHRHKFVILIETPPALPSMTGVSFASNVGIECWKQCQISSLQQENLFVCFLYKPYITLYCL